MSKFSIFLSTVDLQPMNQTCSIFHTVLVCWEKRKWLNNCWNPECKNAREPFKSKWLFNVPFLTQCFKVVSIKISHHLLIRSQPADRNAKQKHHSGNIHFILTCNRLLRSNCYCRWSVMECEERTVSVQWFEAWHWMSTKCIMWTRESRHFISVPNLSV